MNTAAQHNTKKVYYYDFGVNNTLNVSDASKLLGVSPSTLRRLEKEKKITSERAENGYRVFFQKDVEKLRETLNKNEKNSYELPKADKKEKKPENYRAKKIRNPRNLKWAKRILAPEALLLILALTITLFVLNRIHGKELGVSESWDNAVRGVSTTVIKSVPEKQVQKETQTTYHDTTEKFGQVAGKNVAGKVLAARDRVTNYVFNINVPTFVEEELAVGGTTTTQTLNADTVNFTGTANVTNLQAIDDTTETTLEEAIDIDGEVVGTGLNDVKIAEGVIGEDHLKDEISYAGDWDFDGTWSIEGSEVTATAGDINTAAAAGIGSLSTGGVIFGDGSTLKQNLTEFYWDDTNFRLGIGTATPTQSLDVAGGTNTTTFYIGGTQVTSTATELNILDGVTSTTAELNILDGVTSTAAEINYLDGATVVDGGLVYGDGTKVTQDESSLFWDDSSKYLGIGNSSPGSSLHITPGSAAAIKVDPYGTGSGNTGELRFGELSANGAQYTGFKSPDSLDANVLYTLPNSAAAGADYVLTWQTGSSLEWKDVTGVGGAGDISQVGSIISGAAFSDATADDDWIGLGAAAGRILFDDQGTDDISFLDTIVGIGITAPSDTLHVVGNVYATAGLHIGADSTDNLIDDATNGSGSTTMYIGNESILASGDIGVTVQGYDVNTSILGQTIEGSEIFNDTVEEVDLEVTNGPTDNYVLTYDSGTGGFSWTAPGTVGINYWSRTGTTLHPSTAGDTIATAGSVGVGTTAPGDTLDIAGTLRFSADGTNVTNTAQIYMDTATGLTLTGYAGSAYDLAIAESAGGLLISNPAGTSTLALVQGSGSVGIGTTAPSQQLHLTGDLLVAGDDLFMGTNTANYFLMADGTNYNPVTPAAAVTGLGLDAGGAGDVWVEKAGDTMTGNLILNDSVSLILGTSSDFTAAHNGTNTVFDNTFATGSTQFQLGTDTTATAFHVLNNSGSGLFEVDGSGNVGIGNTSPAHLLDVSGNIGLSASSYVNWGATDGDSGYGFKDNSGTLQYKSSGGSWADIGSGGGGASATGPAGSIQFSDGAEALSADPSNFFWDDSNNFLGIGNSVPGGTLHLTDTFSTANELFVGDLTFTGSSGTAVGIDLNIDYSGTTSTAGFKGFDMYLTGDSSVGSGDKYGFFLDTDSNYDDSLLYLATNASSVFEVTTTQATFDVPVNMNSSGDVNVANDLNFTNTTASYVTSDGPMYIQAGNAGESESLYLSSAGTGNVYVDDALFVEKSGATVGTFDRTSSDGTVISIKQAGTEEGTISVSTTTVSYNAFTGSHYAWSNEAIEKGTLVTLTGDNKRLGDRENSEILYGIAPTTVENDPKVLGSYLATLESTKNKSTSNPELVMAAGNGVVWVVETQGNLTAGDYLVSSSVTGHAQKDGRNTLVSNVVGRLAEDIVWSEVTDTTAVIENGVSVVKRRKLASVLFGNFVSYNTLGEVLSTSTSANLDLSNTNVFDNLMITGETSLANVVITKDLRAGLMKVDSLENSINIVGASCYTSSTNTLNENLCGAQALKLQTDLSGNVDIFDGKIVMSPNGNVDIKETVKAKKVVASEYEVSDSSESAGTSTVKAQTLRVSVNTGVVRESSKIFVTPRGNTKGESLYIESVISGESFTVAISNTIGNGLEFDWFIVGVN